MVRPAEPTAKPPQCRHGHEYPRSAARPTHAAGRTQLDPDRGHRHDRMDRAAAGPLPPILPRRSHGRRPVAKLLAGRAHHAFLPLHARKPSTSAADAQSPTVGQLGPRRRSVPLTAAHPPRQGAGARRGREPRHTYAPAPRGLRVPTLDLFQ